jgi:peptidyl-prolyl cis-trans isomerase SurA
MLPVNDSIVIFSFVKKKIYATDWATFIRNKRLFNNDFSPYSQLFNAFIHTSCINYYTGHLEDYNPSIVQQVKEFNEANLLLTISDKEVWRKASEDLVGLKNYYLQHQNNYQWNAGISALIITCNNANIVTEVRNKIEAYPGNWRTIAASYGTTVMADSGRFELTQLPIKQHIEQRVGFVSAPEKSTIDNSYTFLYVTQLHPVKEQKNFNEARGIVVNDYQQILEEKWITGLKQKYPVQINSAVWHSIH